MSESPPHTAGAKRAASPDLDSSDGPTAIKRAREDPEAESESANVDEPATEVPEDADTVAETDADAAAVQPDSVETNGAGEAAEAAGSNGAGEDAEAKKMDDASMDGCVGVLLISTSPCTPRSKSAGSLMHRAGGDSHSNNASSLPAIPAQPGKPADPTPQQIAMRALIVTQDASVIIGRGGAHVNEIRVRNDRALVIFDLTTQDKSSARVTVSESIPGNPERILNVSGALDAVAKVSAVK